jgi:hypothetical protein
MIGKTHWILSTAALFVLFGFAFALGEERFTDNGDGTVTDHLLDVMWAKTDNHGNIDWKGAERWAKYTFPYSLPPEIREDWRLPTLEELQSLYVREEGYEGYESACGQQVKTVPEIELSCGWVWTSERKRITARIFNFVRGYHYTDRMVHNRNYRALPVRDLKTDH